MSILLRLLFIKINILVLLILNITTIYFVEIIQHELKCILASIDSCHEYSLFFVSQAKCCMLNYQRHRISKVLGPPEKNMQWGVWPKRSISEAEVNFQNHWFIRVCDFFLAHQLNSEYPQRNRLANSSGNSCPCTQWKAQTHFPSILQPIVFRYWNVSEHPLTHFIVVIRSSPLKLRSACF